MGQGLPGDADGVVDSFLKNQGSHLFVWLSQADEDSEPILQASIESLPKQRRGSSLVFCHAPDEEVSNSSQIQCMTLQAPAVVATGEDVSVATASSNTPTAVLNALQIYTRQCFMPTIQAVLEDEVAVAGLQDKIRQLDVALQQSSRSTRLPHVVLAIHPTLEQVCAKFSKEQVDKHDWDALGLSEQLADDGFLNELQALANQWINQIRKLTVLPKSTPFMPSEMDAAAEEMAFWMQLQVELGNIQEQLNSPGVGLTTAMLREAKRFVATLALENNTGMEQAVGYTQDVTNFLKDYPLQKLQAAADLEAVAEAMNAVFDHLPKVRQSRYYSLERSSQLLQATTAVLASRILAILQDKYSNLLFMDYKDYESKVHFPSVDVFVQFDDRFDEWKAFLLEQGRRRKLTGLSKVLDKIVLAHVPLRQRLEQIHQFRSGHTQLSSVVHTVLRQEEPAAIQTVDQAPRQVFGSLDVLDLSSSKPFEAALEEYDIQMDAMEERLARLLRDKLTACKDAEDMFVVFARFNLLLTRTRVRAAVKEFQMQLIATVADAIGKLQSKFTLKYESSPAARISRLRGIPPVAGKILWAKQMERQVQTLVERMGNVLGPNWGQQLEGRQLRKTCDELLAKLDAKTFFRNWIREWEKELTSAATSKLNSYPVVIKSVKQKGSKDGQLVATVNFDEKTELLFKEIRHLKWLGYGKEIPRTLTMVADESVKRYPFAVAVKTALRSYQAVRVLVTPELEGLVMPQLLEIRELISEAFDVKLSTSTAVSKKQRVRWETKDMTAWVSKLNDSVSKFEDRVEQLLRACDKVDIALNLLQKVGYESAMFQGVLSSIQTTIDEMSLSGYNDLDSWVVLVGDKIGEVLSVRLELALKGWNKAFKPKPVESQSEEPVEGEAKEEKDDEIEIPDFTKKVKVELDIFLRNQEITPVPSVPAVRSIFLNRLHEFIGVICNLQRPKSGKYEVFESGTGAREAVVEQDYTRLVQKCDPVVLAAAYEAIENHILDASLFVDQWLAYQTLWDTQVSEVAATVGNDIQKWQELLREAADARSTLDSSAAVAEFGPIVIRYGKVHSQM